MSYKKFVLETRIKCFFGALAVRPTKNFRLMNGSKKEIVKVIFFVLSWLQKVFKMKFIHKSYKVRKLKVVE